MKVGGFCFGAYLSIRPINFSDPADKARHDKMVMRVEQMLDLHKRKTQAKDAGEQARLQRLIDRLRRFHR